MLSEKLESQNWQKKQQQLLPTMQIPNLLLYEGDRHLLVNGDRLLDSHMYAAQKMLKEQFPSINSIYCFILHPTIVQKRLCSNFGHRTTTRSALSLTNRIKVKFEYMIVDIIHCHYQLPNRLLPLLFPNSQTYHS